MRFVDITLTPEELAECVRLGRERNRGKSNPHFRHARQSAETVHIQGIVAEAAVAKFFGVQFNREIWATGDRHAPDLEIYGVTFEVKCPFYRPAILKLDDADEFGADAAILTERIDERTVRILGYISREEFMQVHGWRDFGFGRRMILADHGRLHPVGDLKKVLDFSGAGS